MRRLFDRLRIARELDDGPETRDAAPRASSGQAGWQRELAAHRAVEERLRREAVGAFLPHPEGLAARVAARLAEPGEPAPRPPARTPLAARAPRLAAAALVAALAFAAWSRSREPSAVRNGSEPVVAEAVRTPLANADRRLIELAALPRASSARLEAAVDRPLLDEVARLERDTRSLGRSFARNLPLFVLRTDGDGR